MNHYMLMICSDGVATPEKAAVMQREMPSWIERLDATGVRLYGHPLASDATARTVRALGGETMVSDGPFAEAKEFVAGLDILACADRPEAIDAAATHPVARFHAIEVRRLLGAGEVRLPDAEPRSGARCLLMMCLDGMPDEEGSIVADWRSWLAQLNADGVTAWGNALEPASAATTVRLRDGERQLSDGAVIAARAFIGGYAILDCADVDAAVEAAARHPLAPYHTVEVRPFG